MATTSISAMPPRPCHDCGAELASGQEKCWLCHANSVIDAEIVGEPPPAGHAPLQFSLETLLLVVTLSAVCLGALVAAPGLGVLLLVVAIPALVRTCLTGMAARQQHGKLTARDKVLAFLASAAITWAALAAAGMAFFAACTVSLLTGAAVGQAAGNSIDSTLGNILVWTAVAFCGTVSIAAFAGMFWLTWPARPTRR